MHIRPMEDVYMEPHDSHKKQQGQAHVYRREHTKGLFLFPLLAGQGDGLLVANKCMSAHLCNIGFFSTCT